MTKNDMKKVTLKDTLTVEICEQMFAMGWDMIGNNGKVKVTKKGIKVN